MVSKMTIEYTQEEIFEMIKEHTEKKLKDKARVSAFLYEDEEGDVIYGANVYPLNDDAVEPKNKQKENGKC